jgi:hypothetical protein
MSGPGSTLKIPADNVTTLGSFGLAAQQKTRAQDGTAITAKYLILRHHPVASVSKVTLHPYDPSAREEIDGDEYVVSHAGEIRSRPNSSASSLFPPGFQSVRVEYTAGGEVLADVQWACGRLVSAMLSAMGREPGQISETVAGHSRIFAAVAMTTIAGNPELRAVLDRVRNGRVG